MMQMTARTRAVACKKKYRKRAEHFHRDYSLCQAFCVFLMPYMQILHEHDRNGTDTQNK